METSRDTLPRFTTCAVSRETCSRTVEAYWRVIIRVARPPATAPAATPPIRIQRQRTAMRRSRFSIAARSGPSRGPLSRVTGPDRPSICGEMLFIGLAPEVGAGSQPRPQGDLEHHLALEGREGRPGEGGAGSAPAPHVQGLGEAGEIAVDRNAGG